MNYSIWDRSERFPALYWQQVKDAHLVGRPYTGIKETLLDLIADVSEQRRAWYRDHAGEPLPVYLRD